MRDVFKAGDRLFAKFERWLEKVTGSEWDINVNTQTTIPFGPSGGGNNQSQSSSYYSTGSPAEDFPSSSTAYDNAVSSQTTASFAPEIQPAVIDPFLPPDIAIQQAAESSSPLSLTSPASRGFSPSLSTINVISTGLKGGAGSFLKRIAKTQAARVNVEPAIYSVRGLKFRGDIGIITRSQPYKWAGKTVSALNVVAIGLSLGYIVSDRDLSAQKKAAKLAITGGGALATYGVGLLLSGSTLLGAVIGAVTTGVMVEYGKQQLYRWLDLE